jgi:predicted metalloprotease with PDZ domain
MPALIIFSLVSFGSAFAQAPVVEYSLSIRNPVSHLYNVELDISGIRSSRVDVAMPAWSPGVFVIRDFARNVQEFSASTRQNRPLTFEQVDKQTWRISKQEADDVRVRYQVFSTALTDEMADLTPAATFMYVVGHTQAPVSLRFDTENGWKVHSALEKRGDRYVASSYDELAGAPAFIGEFKTIEIKSAAGVAYTVVFSSPRIQMTEAQVEADLEDLANAAAAMLGKAPYSAYTFLVKVQPPPLLPPLSYRSSARMTVGENDFVTVSSYNSFLAGAAQSLVEAWNGNLIRPQAMQVYDLSKESYSRLLWFTKGVSAYLADLLLLRAGITLPAEYFQVASSEINALQRLPGRFMQTLEDASWNAWVRSDNAANAAVSYTLKGKVAALLLDAELRAKSSGAASLETVLRRLAGNGTELRLIAEGALPAEIQSATGINVSSFFASVVRGKSELDYNAILDAVGLKVSVAKNPPTPTFGIEFERTETGQARIRRVLPGSPAEEANLDSGDLILAMDSERVVFDNLVGRIHSKKVGRAVVLSIMRGERLLELRLIPELSQTEVWSIAESLTATPEQVRLRGAMLASTR